jgi:hypothetical protein
MEKSDWSGLRFAKEALLSIYHPSIHEKHFLGALGSWLGRPSVELYFTLAHSFPVGTVWWEVLWVVFLMRGGFLGVGLAGQVAKVQERCFRWSGTCGGFISWEWMVDSRLMDRIRIRTFVKMRLHLRLGLVVSWEQQFWETWHMRVGFNTYKAD